MRTLDLFAGIGGFSLAAQWMGWETAAFVEWDPFCQKVLAKNFPDVPIYGDINQFSYEQEKERIGTVDLVCGGFPCQPFSTAGKRNGTGDDRYLWPSMLRVIREVKPTWVVGENVAGLLTMDGGAVFEEVCTSLEDEGYAVQAFVLPAIAKGAPHRRDRVWIIAHSDQHKHRADGRSLPEEGGLSEVNRAEQLRTGRIVGADSTCNPADNRRCIEERGWDRCAGGWQSGAQEGLKDVRRGTWRSHWMEVATRFCRVDDGLSSELDKLRNSNRTNRLKALGNAIVPQIAYEIFRAIEEEF